MARMTEETRALRLTSKDNVATLLSAVAPGGKAMVRDFSAAANIGIEVIAREAIPAGHKMAIEQIAPGDDIIKYGLAIARASVAIAPGEHVHVHNAGSKASSKPSPAMPQIPPTIISVQDLRSILSKFLAARGVPGLVAENLSDHLVEAHLRGVETHGIRRLMPYLARIDGHGVDAKAEPMIESIGGLLRVDGRNGLGHHVATTAADAVATAAEANGVAVALVRNSSHFGFAGYYATRIAKRGMASMVTSNGQVMVGPHGALRAIFSNDPIAIAAPLSADTFFEFDMATSVTSRANIVQAASSGARLQPGQALDCDGFPTTDAKAAVNGILLPFGGDKGFGLIAAIELLTGVLTGGPYADGVGSKELNAEMAEGTAHFMLAISLQKALGCGLFMSRLNDMVERIAMLPMREGIPQPRHPGLRRWALRRERLKCGIPLSTVDADTVRRLAQKIAVPHES